MFKSPVVRHRPPWDLTDLTLWCGAMVQPASLTQAHTPPLTTYSLRFHSSTPNTVHSNHHEQLHTLDDGCKQTQPTNTTAMSQHRHDARHLTGTLDSPCAKSCHQGRVPKLSLLCSLACAQRSELRPREFTIALRIIKCNNSARQPRKAPRRRRRPRTRGGM